MVDDPMNRTKVKRGEELPQARLTEGDVRIIRELIEERVRLHKEARALTNKRIAEKFGVHIRTIDRINSGETWGHVE